MKLAIRALPIGLTLFALTACETFTGVAPEGTPRVEVELAVVVQDDFFSSLVDVDEYSELVANVRRAVRPHADLGLRFYATPTESYGSGDLHPPYFMTVELNSLSLRFKDETVEREDAKPVVVTTLTNVIAKVTASIERRRVDAPALVVGRSSAVVEVRAEKKAEVLDAQPGYATLREGEVTDLKVLHQDVLRAVDGAVKKALNALRTPIDREFAVEKDPDEKGSDQKAAESS